MKERNLLEDKTITKDLMTFQIKKLSILKWILVVTISFVPFLIILPYIMTLLPLIIPIFISVIVISPIFWKKTVNFFLKKMILDNLDKWKQGSKMHPLGKIVNSFLGLDIAQRKYYYLEACITNIDMNSLSHVIKDRIFHVSSACLGISFTIGTALKFSPLYTGDGGIIEMIVSQIPSLYSTYGGINAIIALIIISIGLSPLFLGWLIPIIWTLQDSNVKITTPDRKVSDLGETISNSSIRRLLGIAGYLLAFSFILDTKQFIATAGSNIIQTYIMAAVVLFIFICLNIGTSLIIGSIYLNKFHAKLVNDFRINLAQILKINNTLVRELTDEERKLFSN